MNNQEEQEVDIGELVSFRQEEPELGEEGENAHNLFYDQSMEFVDNQAQITNQLPFDCTQFYL